MHDDDDVIDSDGKDESEEVHNAPFVNKRTKKRLLLPLSSRIGEGPWHLSLTVALFSCWCKAQCQRRDWVCLVL